MFAGLNAKRHTSSTSAMFAEAAASFCAIFLLGSAITAEPIFVIILFCILICVLIVPFDKRNR